MITDKLYRKDKQEFLFNPFTGNLDLVLAFNENRIVTHSYGASGALLLTYDPRSGQHIPLGPLVVTDLAGNVVVV